jgi:hypothetical protein
MQEPPRSAGDADSADDAGTHCGGDMDWWMDDLHLVYDHGSDHGADTEYNHGGTPPRVIRTIIRDSGNIQWPVLTKTNYTEWSSMMKVKLETQRMWNTTHLGSASRHEDRQPLEALLSAVPPEMIPALSSKARLRTQGMPLPLPDRNSDRSGITWPSSQVGTSTTLLYVPSV